MLNHYKRIERIKSMKKISLVGRMRHIAYILIVMQGILLALLTIFFLSQTYMAAWMDYPGDAAGTSFYLKGIPEENRQIVETYIYEKAYDEGLFIVRKDSLLKNDGSFGGYMLGVYGETSHVDAQLQFMGMTVVNAAQIDQLLASENSQSTLGLDAASVHMLAEIPHFRFGEKIVIKKLPQVITESNTVNGTYKVCGLPESSEQFLKGLEEITGMTMDELLKPMNGRVQDDRLARDILLAFLTAQIVLNIVALLVAAVRNLGKQGKLALLGWSKAAFTWGIFENIFLFSLGCIPVLLIAGYLMSGWGRISVMLLRFFLLSAFLNVLLAVLEMLIASIVIFATPPINAIHGRIPKKTLYLFGVAGYLLLSACVMFCGVYLDTPVQYMSENSKLYRQWEQVEKYEILGGISVGEDADTIAGRSNQLDRDIYNWYSDIADRDGVYLIHTTYYDSEVLALWRQNSTYQSIPDKPFWYFAVSPNYLENLGIHLADDLLAKAKKGTRVYLFPESMTQMSRSLMKEWIEEDTTRSLSSADIQTEFTKHPAFAYAAYEPETEFFTWPAKTELPSAVKEAVIYVATPENMIYFETESLRADGLNNGYLKFSDKETKDLYTQESDFARHHLSDNELVFIEARNYIDGIQKTLLTAIAWFGMVFLVLLLILIGFLLILATIFRIANQEKINVKKFLGFPFWHIYRWPVVFLISVSALDLVVMLILRSKFGFLIMMLVALVQAIIFINYMSRNELKRVLSAFKGE